MKTLLYGLIVSGIWLAFPLVAHGAFITAINSPTNGQTYDASLPVMLSGTTGSADCVPSPLVAESYITWLWAPTYAFVYSIDGGPDVNYYTGTSFLGALATGSFNIPLGVLSSGSHTLNIRLLYQVASTQHCLEIYQPLTFTVAPSGSPGSPTPPPLPSPPSNTEPVAAILIPTTDMTAAQTTSVFFSGSGTDPDPGNTLAAYEWREGSCVTGTLLATASSFALPLPDMGARTIFLRVQDSQGAWSTNCPSRTITVNEPTFKVCVNACNSNVMRGSDAGPTGFALASGTAEDLVACYNTASACNAATPQEGDVTSATTWTELADPQNVLTLAYSAQTGQTRLTATGNGPATFEASYDSSAVTSTMQVNVTCSPTYTCATSPQRNAVCAGDTYTINDDGCGSSLSCPGTRSCDFNWREVAP